MTRRTPAEMASHRLAVATRKREAAAARVARAHEEVTGALAALAVAQTAEAYAAAHPLLASSPEDGGE